MPVVDIPGESFQSRAEAVGHPVIPGSDVGRAEARSAGFRNPEGISRCVQVSRYKVEPSIAVCARNLLANDERRLALFDEIVECGPDVPLVIKPLSFACLAERLARSGSRPKGRIVVPSVESRGEAPDADPGEEVALPKRS
jgi:hypothetical protein